MSDYESCCCTVFEYSQLAKITYVLVRRLLQAGLPHDKTPEEVIIIDPSEADAWLNLRGGIKNVLSMVDNVSTTTFVRRAKARARRTGVALTELEALERHAADCCKCVASRDSDDDEGAWCWDGIILNNAWWKATLDGERTM